MMAQQRIVDIDEDPLRRGWRVVDEVASMPRGNVPTRWAISTSLVASNNVSSDEEKPRSLSSSKTAAAPIAPPDTNAKATLNEVPQAFSVNIPKKWTENDVRRLVSLRARRVPYDTIAQVSSHPCWESCCGVSVHDTLISEGAGEEMVD